MAKKKSKSREKQRQQQKARKAAKKKQTQQSRRSFSPSPNYGAGPEPMADGDGIELFSSLVVSSENLADEPEFADIFINPQQCVMVWGRAVEAAHIDVDSLGQLADDERNDIMFDLNQRTVKRVLTADLRREIIKQADALQQRYKDTNNKKGFLQASAVHIFLSANKKGQNWSMVGLVRALVLTSLDVGFQLSEIVEGDPEQILSDPQKRQRLEALLNMAPGLRRHVSKEMDNIWDESLDDIFNGRWAINLFTPEEIGGSTEIFKRNFPDNRSPDKGELEARSTQLISELDGYIRRLLTPERLEQMNVYLTALSADLSGKQQVFVTLLKEDVKTEDNLDYLMPALLRIFLAEARFSVIQVELDMEESE